MRLSKMKVLKSALRCRDNVMENVKFAQKVYKTTCMYKVVIVFFKCRYLIYLNVERRYNDKRSLQRLRMANKLYPVVLPPKNSFVC